MCELDHLCRGNLSVKIIRKVILNKSNRIRKLTNAIAFVFLFIQKTGINTCFLNE